MSSLMDLINTTLDPAAQVAVALVVGLMFGSFANVCIHRMPERKSIVWPGSACPGCKASIAWYDNIPVLSFIILGGRCRGCRTSIPFRYPLIEALSGVLLAALCIRDGLTVQWMAEAWLTLSILILVPIDLHHGILPDLVTLPGIAMGLLFSLSNGMAGFNAALWGAVAGGMVPFLVRLLYMAYVRTRSALGGRPVENPGEPAEPSDQEEERREGMGLGDVKMLAMVGAFLGVGKVLLTMLLGSVIGSLYVVPLVLIGRQSMKTSVPFGPFLGLAALISLFAGAEIIDWYLGLVISWT